MRRRAVNFASSRSSLLGSGRRLKMLRPSIRPNPLTSSSMVRLRLIAHSFNPARSSRGSSIPGTKFDGNFRDKLKLSCDGVD